MTFLPSSRARLTRYDRARFSGETLFDRLGRAVCEAGCLPRKELYEAWEVGKRVRRWIEHHYERSSYLRTCGSNGPVDDRDDHVSE